MPDLTLTQILLLAAGGFLVTVGICGLAPMLLRSRRHPITAGSLRIRDSDLYSAFSIPAQRQAIRASVEARFQPPAPEPLLPEPTEPAVQPSPMPPSAISEASDAEPDEAGMVEVLASEMFALRATMDELLIDVRTMRVILQSNRRSPVARAQPAVEAQSAIEEASISVEEPLAAEQQRYFQKIAPPETDPAQPTAPNVDRPHYRHVA